MKKTISFLTLSAIVIALVFTGCKKGENDPFLSLKSRTGRLAQEWKLSSEDYTTVSKTGSVTTTEHYTYDGSIETITTTYTLSGNSSTSTATKTYSKETTFDKDGTYKETEINDGDATTTEGTWMWVKKNKDNGLKNQEAIVMFITKQTDSNGDTETYDGKSNIALNGIVVFDKLASDEVIMKYDFTNTNSDGDTYSMTGTQTFTKK